jgi:hypothetical protein
MGSLDDRSLIERDDQRFRWVNPVWSPPGIEPATPSLPWNHQEPLCGPPFPSSRSTVEPNVIGSPWRSYALSQALGGDPCELLQRLATIGGLADDLHVGFAVEEATQPFAHDLVIVDHQDVTVRWEGGVIAGPGPRLGGRCRDRACL